MLHIPRTFRGSLHSQCSTDELQVLRLPEVHIEHTFLIRHPRGNIYFGGIELDSQQLTSLPNLLKFRILPILTANSRKSIPTGNRTVHTSQLLHISSHTTRDCRSRRSCSSLGAPLNSYLQTASPSPSSQNRLGCVKLKINHTYPQGTPQLNRQRR